MSLRSTLFSWVLVASSTLAVASTCSTKVKNVEFCRDKGKFGAVCAYWLNARDTKRLIPLSEWNQKRLGMVCTSEEGMGNVKALVEKLCQQSKSCIEMVNELVKAIEVNGPL